jgi:hypothetical protein
MRTLLRVVALTAVLAGASACGDNVSNTGAPRPATPDPAVVEILSAPNAGGEVDTEVTVFDDAGDLDRFADQFGGSPLAADLGSAFRAHESDDMQLGAAVVSIGCDVPTSATVTEPEEGVYVVDPMIEKSGNQCLVPVTTVAVVEVPAAREE